MWQGINHTVAGTERENTNLFSELDAQLMAGNMAKFGPCFASLREQSFYTNSSINVMIDTCNYTAGVAQPSLDNPAKSRMINGSYVLKER